MLTSGESVSLYASGSPANAIANAGWCATDSASAAVSLSGSRLTFSMMNACFAAATSRS